MNKLGFSEREVNHMYFGKWSGLFDAYRRFYSMEHPGVYAGEHEKKKVSLLSL